MKQKTKPISASLPLAHVDKDTLQERVFRQLSNLILDGEIAPGQLVTIQSLADSLGVSAMPVREALKRLTAANALTVVYGRSIGIPPLTVDRLKDLRNVRIEIEGLATEWAVDHFTPVGIAVLDEQYEKMKEAIAAKNAKGFLRSNRAFHFEIYRTAGSPVALRIIENLWLQISPYFSLLHESGNPKTANKHHAVMIKAIRKRDKAAARAASRADIDSAYKVLLTLLS